MDIGYHLHLLRNELRMLWLKKKLGSMCTVLRTSLRTITIPSTRLHFNVKMYAYKICKKLIFKRLSAQHVCYPAMMVSSSSMNIERTNIALEIISLA